MRVLLASFVAATLIVSACSTGGASRSGNGGPASGPPTTSTPSDAIPDQMPSGEAQRVRAPLDALTMSLSLGEPRPDGAMTSRIRVQNGTPEPVIDPGCRRFANYVAGVARPGSPREFIGPTTGALTKCGGPETLAPGYDETRRGPTFRVHRLPVGTFVAVIDFEEARTRLLVREFSIEE